MSSTKKTRMHTQNCALERTHAAMSTPLTKQTHAHTTLPTNANALTTSQPPPHTTLSATNTNAQNSEYLPIQCDCGPVTLGNMRCGTSSIEQDEERSSRRRKHSDASQQ